MDKTGYQNYADDWNDGWRMYTWNMPVESCKNEAQRQGWWAANKAEGMALMQCCQ